MFQVMTAEEVKAWDEKYCCQMIYQWHNSAMAVSELFADAMNGEEYESAFVGEMLGSLWLPDLDCGEEW